MATATNRNSGVAVKDKYKYVGCTATLRQVPEKETDLGLLQLGLQRRSWLRRPVVPIPLPNRAIDLHKPGEKGARRWVGDYMRVGYRTRWK